MRSSYLEDDVILLLKDITGLVEPQNTEERERRIQSGRHYSEMLPIEYVPSEKYMEAYRNALDHFSAPTARAVERLAEIILQRRGGSVVLVSLARAGIPAGILLKRYMRTKYRIDVPHYSISIIRGRGIDDNAVKYLLERYPAGDLLFVDGWIGKGAILGELKKSVEPYGGLSPELAVLADPAGVTELCGTHEDLLIPSSCLNSTVSGLISRTFLRDDIIGKDDFHGAVYYGELKDADLSYDFIRRIESEFEGETGGTPERKQDTGSADLKALSAAGASDEQTIPPAEGASDERIVPPAAGTSGIDEVREIARRFQIGDINLIKPGIGEATRVLLRRVPWKILIGESSKGDAALTHLIRLAQEKGVPVEYYPLVRYKACGIIRRMADA